MKKILFIHGNSLSSTSFQFQSNSTFLGRRFDMYALDLPGHGKGKRHPGYSIDLMIQSIREFVRKHQMNDVYLVGHSLGGHLLIEMLKQDLEFTVSGLLVFGTPPLCKPMDPSAFQPNPVMMYAYQPDLADEQVTELSEALGSRDFTQMIREADPQVRSSIGQDILAGNFIDEVEVLREFKGRMGIIHGANDPLVNLDYIKKLDLNLWKNGVQMIPGAGHSPQYTAAEKFNSLLNDFVSDE